MRHMITGPRQKYLNNPGGAILLRRLREHFGRVAETDPASEWIIGDANGIDAAAWNLAGELGHERRRFKADWDRHGKRAGPVRNGEMVEVADECTAFWNGLSSGTRNAMEQAQRAGKLNAVWYSNGLQWCSERRWDPIVEGATMMKYNRYYLAVTFTERLKKNADSPRLDDAARLDFANDRTLTALNWLWEGNVPELVREGEYQWWYVFKSNSRGNRVHYASLEHGRCGCEGWTIQKQPCWHMHALWLYFHQAEVVERELGVPEDAYAVIS